MGINVFGFAESDTLVADTIDAIEAFYVGLGVPVQLSEHGKSKKEAIDEIIDQLEKHGMLALGESQAITLEVTRAILEDAVV
jgi:NADP-dependent alcohol dehydrogenase